MTIEIISGPEELFRGSCTRCGTTFRCTWADRFNDEGGDDYLNVDCPVCKAETYAVRIDEAAEAA
ncbi:hypothetical protein [Jiella sp. M17.18]|uniref:hypothetical protein n=1 Tax=Jiella sp. M17.18 TaxID=3234247 RepID=UPI0034DE9E3B